MTKHILCAVDLTHDADARALLAEAGRLAKLYSARLSAITVLPDYGSSWVGTFFQEGALDEARRTAAAALERMVAEVLPQQENARCMVALGSVYDKVLQAIAACGADLVIVGAHRPDFKDRLLGPNAARVVRNASISVLVIRL